MDNKTFLKDIEKMIQPLYENQKEFIEQMNLLQQSQRSLLRQFESLDEKQTWFSQQLTTLEQGQNNILAEQESIKTELQNQTKTLKNIKRKVNRIDKTVDIIGRTYDERIADNARGITGIKVHLGLPTKN